jgi:hypothetical protein
MKSNDVDYIPSRRLAFLSESETYTISNYLGQGSKLIVRFAKRVSDEEVYVDFYFDGGGNSGPPEIPTLQNPCNGEGKALFQLVLLTDNFGDETSWSLTNKASGQTLKSGSGYASNAAYPETECIPRGVDYTFEIKDSHSDGMCCHSGQGSYTVSVDGEVVASGGEFQFEEATTFFVSGENPEQIPTPNPTPA